MERLNFEDKNLRKFGFTLGAAFLILTVILLAKHRHNILPTSIISALFFISASTFAQILKPVYIIWMKLAYILGWINTRLILLIIFYLVFVPVALLMKLFSVDLLDRKIEKEKNSHWKKKEVSEFDKLNYERQF